MPITDAKKLNSSSILSTMLDNQELSLRSFPCSALQIYTKIIFLNWANLYFWLLSLLSQWAALTCGHLANQHSIEFDDGAEGVFAVSCGCQDLAVALQHQFVILLLQQHQDVLQQQSVQICPEHRQQAQNELKDSHQKAESCISDYSCRGSNQCCAIPGKACKSSSWKLQQKATDGTGSAHDWLLCPCVALMILQHISELTRII